MNGYVVATLIAATLSATVGWLRWRLRVVTVVGDSMRPTLAPGDRLLVRRLPFTRVQTGDIVVLALPEGAVTEPLPGGHGDNWLIKRVVATAGEPVPASVASVLSVPPGSPVRAGALLAIGDNPKASYDSREFGYVHAADVLGVVIRPIHTGSV